IAELHAFHPRLAIVFAGNRKLAQEWCHRFFSAVAAHRDDAPHRKISEVITRYGTPPEASGGSFYALKRAMEHDFPAQFTIATVREAFPDVPETTVKRALRDLKAKGAIESVGRGKKSYWRMLRKR
ncbi:MAG: hypothetical protein PHU03_07070, partial [Syntrophales bacterium]|nr:hypothetical protein [Syntrophales bacterium]